MGTVQAGSARLEDLLAFDDELCQSNSAEDPRLLPYMEPGQRVDIGGRRINLHCIGFGEPTVILLAGLSSWAPEARDSEFRYRCWRRWQPSLESCPTSQARPEVEEAGGHTEGAVFDPCPALSAPELNGRRGVDWPDHPGLELGYFTDNRVFGVGELSAASGAGLEFCGGPIRGRAGKSTSAVGQVCHSPA